MTTIIYPNWNAPACIKACTTTRQAWQGQQQSTDDTEQLRQLLALPTAPSWLTQKHTATALVAKQDNLFAIGDASFTIQPDVVCAVITADCLPILLTNENGSEVAAIHAGWRGLAGGIIANTIAQMQKHTPLIAWLGPAISQTHFEVGRDVYDAFLRAHPALVSAFLSTGKEKWHADLYAIATFLLRLENVDRISGGDYCTYSQSDYFYSYRRDQGNTGRMASLIWIDSNYG